MNTLTLDLTQPDIAAAVKNCKAGEHCEFTVGGKFNTTGKLATVAVDEVKYTDDGDPDEDAAKDAAESAPKSPKAPAADGAAPAPGAKKMAPAIAIVMGQGKPK